MKNTVVRFLLTVFFLRLLAAPIHFVKNTLTIAVILAASVLGGIWMAVESIWSYLTAPLKLLLHNYFHLNHKTWVEQQYGELKPNAFFYKTYRAVWQNPERL